MTRVHVRILRLIGYAVSLASSCRLENFYRYTVLDKKEQTSLA